MSILLQKVHALIRTATQIKNKQKEKKKKRKEGGWICALVYEFMN